MSTIFLKHFKLILIISILSLMMISSWSIADKTTHLLKEGRNNTLFEQDGKYRGVNFFLRRGLDSNSIEALTKNNIEFVVIVPYAYQENNNTAELRIPDKTNSRYLRRDSMYVQLHKELTKNGLGMIIKPHIWMRKPGQNGGRANIQLSSQDEWSIWKSRYRSMIIHYAEMSENLKLPLYCIGTELASVVKEHPNFWKELIKEVRQVYSGKLTYAANWYEEYQQVSFWNQLDYIGIQGYFPLTESINPSVSNIQSGWENHVSELKRFYKKHKKPILFTELGYSSTEDAAIKPWEWVNRNTTKSLSLKTQENCYEAFFKSFWGKNWFAGVLLWEWQSNHERTGGSDNLNFTPQNKPAELTIANWFGQPGAKSIYN